MQETVKEFLQVCTTSKNIRKCIQILAHFYLDCTLRHCYNKVWPNVRFIEKGLRDLFGKPGVLS